MEKSGEYHSGYAMAKLEQELEDIKSEINKLEEENEELKAKNKELQNRSDRLEKLESAGVSIETIENTIDAEKQLTKLQKKIKLLKILEKDKQVYINEEIYSLVEQKTEQNFQKLNDAQLQFAGEMSLAQDKLFQSIISLVHEAHKMITELRYEMYGKFSMLCRLVMLIAKGVCVDTTKEQATLDAVLRAFKADSGNE